MHDFFRPLIGANILHLQTLLPRLVRRRVLLKPRWHRLELPNGDFVDLACNADLAQAAGEPRVVVFHGLKGNFYSPYTHGLLNSCREKRWLGVMMHFRGCSGVPNRKLLHYPDALPLRLLQLNRLRRICEFDEAITSRIHGFSDATDYYRRCSAPPLLPAIKKLLMIIHAQDGYFMTDTVIPEGVLLPRNIDCQLTGFGGDTPKKTANMAGIPYSILATPLSGHSDVIIPWKKLETETLNSLIESFVLREGTDYGEHERSLAQKVDDVRRQLQHGEVLLVWSELHETVNIMPRGQIRAGQEEI